jgi:hypothetical protein
VDSGWAAVIGALVGGAATLIGAFLTDFIQQRRQAKADEPRRKLLKKMLEGGHNWRKLETLANVTGLSPSETKRLLVDIGARGSETDGNLWGLISRNPIPTYNSTD